MRCADCLYYATSEGQCRARPPVIITRLHRSDPRGIQLDGHWPRTAVDDWCGAGVPRPAAKPTAKP